MRHRDRLGGQIVVAEPLAIAFQRALAKFVDARFEIKGELHVGAKQVSFDGRGIGPVEGLLEKQQAGHRVEFFGRPAVRWVVMPADGLGGHEFEERLSERSPANR